MKFFKPHILFVIIVLCLGSCKKDSNTIRVEGIITDLSTGLPLENATVELIRFTSFGWSVTGKTLSKIQTNSKGYYLFSFSPPAGEDFLKLGSYKENYLGEIADTKIDLTNGKQDYNISLSVRPKAELLFEVEDVAPFDSIKSFDIFHTYDYTAMGDIEFADYKILLKPGIKAIGKTQTGGNHYVKVSCFYDKYNGERIIIKDSIYCPAFQTTTYRIER